MKFGRLGIFATAAMLVVGASAAALAGNTVLFSPNQGDLTFPLSPPTRDAPGALDNTVIGASNPQAVNGTTGSFSGAVTASQINAALGGYQKNPASVASYRAYQFAQFSSMMLFTPSGTVAYAYATLYGVPLDGQESCIFSTQAVTAFYLRAGGATSINNAITALVANTRYCYLYSASNTTWDRSQ